MQTISGLCCSKQPWKMKWCLPSEPRASLLTACSERGRFPEFSVPVLECSSLHMWHLSGPHHPCGTWGKGEPMYRPPNNRPLVKVSEGHSALPTICRHLILLSTGKVFPKINSKRFLTPPPSLPPSPHNLVGSMNTAFPRKGSSPLGHLLGDDQNNEGREYI